MIPFGHMSVAAIDGNHPIQRVHVELHGSLKTWRRHVANLHNSCCMQACLVPSVSGWAEIDYGGTHGFPKRKSKRPLVGESPDHTHGCAGELQDDKDRLSLNTLPRDGGTASSLLVPIIDYLPHITHGLGLTLD